MSCHPILNIAKEVILLNFPNGSHVGKRIADLGCLGGGYTLEFAKMGLVSLGVEARKNNFENCIHIKNTFNIPDLNFVQDDVWNIERYGRFDIIFCCGLLYHLQYPKKFINILSKICDKLLILDTHYSSYGTAPASLTSMTVNEGIVGRYYKEFDSICNAKNESSKWSSWGNKESFWPLLSEIIGTLSCDFREVSEIKSETRNISNARATLVALK